MDLEGCPDTRAITEPGKEGSRGLRRPGRPGRVAVAVSQRVRICAEHRAKGTAHRSIEEQLEDWTR